MHGNNTARKSPRKVFNSARHAARWLGRGICPVPLEAGTKRPKGERNGSAKGANGWTKLRITEETASEYFKEGDNLGGLWGEPSGWAIDVDLDTPEAQAAARYFLPETLIYGRHQAPHSHYIFRCKNSETKKYHTKDIGMIVEIRSTGSQSGTAGINASVRGSLLHRSGRSDYRHRLGRPEAARRQVSRFCHRSALLP